MLFRQLMTPIDLDRIAHRLERMKRKTDRKQDLQQRDRIIGMEGVQYLIQVDGDEIVILKNRQDADIGDDAQHQQMSFLPFVGLPVNPDPREIVDHDRESQDQDVDRLEEHVKETAGRQQEQPLEPVRQHEEED